MLYNLKPPINKKNLLKCEEENNGRNGIVKSQPKNFAFGEKLADKISEIKKFFLYKMSGQKEDQTAEKNDTGYLEK